MNSDVAHKIEQFFGQYKLRKYPKGQILLLNGDDTDYVYNLVEGRVKMYDVSYRGDEIVLNIFKPPAFFPMSLALNKVANPYIFESDSKIAVRQAPVQDVLDFIAANPDVVLDLLARVYRGTDGLMGRMVQLMSGSAQSRLIYEMIVEARRFGVYDKNKIGCALKISEKELGTHAGLSRETVSREINKLKHEGYIASNARKIHIINVEKLEKKLGQVI